MTAVTPTNHETNPRLNPLTSPCRLSRQVKTDMRDVEGLQTEPDYKTVGLVVCKGRGNHMRLAAGQLDVVATAELKKGDGVYVDLGWLEADEMKYVVIPYTDEPGVEVSTRRREPSQPCL